jgi:hypothetical protein
MKTALKQIFKEVLAMAMSFAITVVGISAAIASLVVTVERDGLGTVFVIWVLSMFCWLPLLGFWRNAYIEYFDRFFKKK